MYATPLPHYSYCALRALIRPFSVAALLLVPSVVWAQETSNSTTAPTGTIEIPLPEQSAASAAPQEQPQWAKIASGKGALLYGAAGTLLPLTEGGRQGRDDTLRVADSVLVSGLVTEALKALTHEQRPDGSDYKSFPSGHATAAFSIATMQAHFHPNQAIFWYAGASIIAASRVKLRRHRIQDVLAGAAIGIATSRIEIRQSRGLLLAPFIKGDGRNRSSGIALGRSF